MHKIDENEVLRDALSGLNEEIPAMPEGLHAAWMQQVENDAAEKRSDTNLTRKSFTRFLSMAAALVFVVGGTLLTRDDLAPMAGDEKSNKAVTLSGARGASEPSVANGLFFSAYDEEAASDGMVYGVTTARSMPTEEGISAEADAAAPVAPTEKKIIRTASLTIQTQTFEDSLATLRNLCESSGGWIENINESVSGSTGLRTAWLTLRVPQDTLDGYIDASAACGRVTNRSQSATDVTASYQDTRRRLNNQLALMERLEDLVDSSASLADLLALESQLADTQYKIDTLQASLNSTDRQVNYSTVDITLREETDPSLTDSTVSLGARIAAGLRMGCEAVTTFAQDALVFLVAALPFGGIVGAFAGILFIIRKIARRKKS